MLPSALSTLAAVIELAFIAVAEPASVIVTSSANSDVLPPGSVAVAVTTCPGVVTTWRVVAKDALPLASVLPITSLRRS